MKVLVNLDGQETGEYKIHQLPKFVEKELHKQVRRNSGIEKLSGGLRMPWYNLDLGELSHATLAYLALLGFKIKVKDTSYTYSIVMYADEKFNIIRIVQYFHLIL